ncbi:hypothetical protein [Frigoribacterium sp. SL97]|uniref:hypothetical protein n=1 Tax=Frigoribacterium sp. SL97 TaxID=2994664 RepID=UPI00226F5F83|nr:hypothetical protein [Frigoribacterium sp. SL97]WAC51759.1 hypothetical protein OVA02_00310 [Frigoribacterium sp. SL97]
MPVATGGTRRPRGRVEDGLGERHDRAGELALLPPLGEVAPVELVPQQIGSRREQAAVEVVGDVVRPLGDHGQRGAERSQLRRAGHAGPSGRPGCRDRHPTPILACGPWHPLTVGSASNDLAPPRGLSTGPTTCFPVMYALTVGPAHLDDE